MDRKEENLSITSTEVEKAKEVKDGARGRERLKEKRKWVASLHRKSSSPGAN